LILDLCKNSQLQSHVFDALRKISCNKSNEFNDLIGNVSETLSKNVDWWVEQSASRNTLQSPLFYRFCCIHLIIKLIQSGTNIEKVIVDSAALFKIIKELKEKKNLIFEIEGPEGELPSFQFYIRKSLKPFFEMYKKKRSQFRAAIKTKSLSTEPPRSGLTLIDKFVFPNFITKERYYNGLWDTLSSEQQQKTFFVPTLVMIKDEDFEEAYRELRNCDINFLIKEDYLTFSDLLFSLFHLFRVWFIKPFTQQVASVDISSLIREEMLSRVGFNSALEGLLNYRFAQRLKEKSFDLSLVIDWWEGQPLDKGWNFGFHTFFPETPIKGYLGYVPRLMELQLYPSESEVKFGVVPDTISTIGVQFSSDMESKKPPFQTETAPAFRFGHLWDNGIANERGSDDFKILLALSVMLDESVHILEQFIACGLDFEQNAIEILIKPHPTMSVEILKNYVGKKWINHFREVEGFTPDYIRKSDLLITGMSSVGLEAVVMGVPVIVVEKLSGLSYNPIPDSVPKELWRNCRSPKEISEAVHQFKNRSTEDVTEHRELSANIKKDYFEPVTKESVYKFLELNN
jgi:hypothetical protein